MPYIVTQNNFTQAEASLITTLRSFFGLGAKLLTLWFIKKLDVRRSVTIACLFSAAAFWLYSAASGHIGYYLAASVSGIAYGLGSMIPASIILNRWFKDKLALSIGICAASTGIASMVSPTLITIMVERFSLSAAFLIVSVFTLAVSFLIYALVRNDPSDKGLTPYVNAAARSEKTERIDYVKPAFKELSKWNNRIINAAPMLIGAIALTSTGVFSLHFVKSGFSSMTAATAISIYGLTMLLGKIIYGIITDVIGSYYSNFLFIGFLVTGFLLCCFIEGSTICLFVSIALIGAGLSLSTVGISVWAADLAAPEKYDRTVRRFQVVYALGGLLFAPCAGILADLYGSYSPVFAILGLMAFVTFIVIRTVYRSKMTPKVRRPPGFLKLARKDAR